MSGIFLEQNGCETNIRPLIPQPFVRLNGYSECQWNSSGEYGQVTKAAGPGNKELASTAKSCS
jgi:hypothetical protein